MQIHNVQISLLYIFYHRNIEEDSLVSTKEKGHFNRERKQPVHTEDIQNNITFNDMKYFSLHKIFVSPVASIIEVCTFI